MNEDKSKIIKKQQADEELSIETKLGMRESVPSLLSDERKVVSREDVEAIKKGKDIIAQAIAEAAAIKEKAKNLFLQVEKKIREAKNNGFEEGRQEGLATVTEMLVQLKKNREEMLRQIEKEAVTLVHEIARKIISDTLKTSDDALVGMIRQALQSSMGEDLTVFVSPEDHERLKSLQNDLLAGVHHVKTFHLRASENVKPGGCVIESEMGTIDAQLDYQLEAIKKALGIS